MPAEAAVRDALRCRLLGEAGGVTEAVAEFWVPRSQARADLAVIGESMDGFEIKTAQDTLRRLPWQASAYARVFDRCTVVVAAKHQVRVLEMLPEWWGVTVVSVNRTVAFTEIRAAGSNPAVDAETLVRLLWRDEAMTALTAVGLRPDKRSSRGSLWKDLLELPLAELRSVVRRAILQRDPGQARIGTRRFTTPPGTAAAGP